MIFSFFIKENNMKYNFKNPYFPLGDPYVLYHEGTYYLYGTTEIEDRLLDLNDFKTSKNGEDGFYVYTSKDLINWQNQGLCLKKGDAIGEKWFWAPEVTYYNGKFYMAYAVDEHVAIAVANSPLGPFKQEEKKYLRENPSIDGHIFIDDDGSKYFYYVGFNGGNRIYVAKLSDDLLSITEEYGELIKAEEAWETVDCLVAEGPFVLKENGVYYLSYSTNHTRNPAYAVGYATSNSPLGPFKKYKNNPILYRNEQFWGVGHHAFCKIPNTNEYLCSFHCHNPKSDNFRPRYFCLSTARFEEKNGETVIVIDEPKKGK